MHCAYDSNALLNEPPNVSLQTRLERVLSEFIDPYVGRKIAPVMLKLGLRNVTVQIEADPIITFVGAIDAERRHNMEMQRDAIRPYVIQALGSAQAAEELFNDAFAYWDDPNTCTYTPLYFVKGTRA